MKTSNCLILQHEQNKPQLMCQDFKAENWLDKPGTIKMDSGRGGSIKIDLAGKQAILRPYYRGGFIAKLFTDEYLWWGKSRTRCWREWDVLLQAAKAGLPVPKVMGVCVFKHRIWYRAVIITQFIDKTETLAERLKHKSLNVKCWQRLGKVIKSMHLAGIHHADLNASNILIDDKDHFYLIDFDKAKMRKKIGEWQWRPLYRLQGSIEKFSRNHQLHYHSDDWQYLIDGYQQ